MKSRNLFLALGATSLLASSALPASAQVGDFFCSTFSLGCEPPPPPPPPPLAPVVEEPAPKKVRHAKAKPKKHTAAPKTAEQTASPDAAPK